MRGRFSYEHVHRILLEALARGQAQRLSQATAEDDDLRRHRQGKDNGPDNHLLGFVHEYGSPAANIPARPFLRPGVKSAHDQIASGLEQALKAALRDDADGMQAALDMTGIQAVSAVKSFMRDPSPPFVELKPATLRNRHRSRMTKTKRENEVLNESVKPLLNTGALRNAIDYYIED